MPSRTAKGRPSREERRAQLVDAAVEAIRQHGPGASMEQLAAQAGVTKPILYRHFGDREGLAEAIGERFLETLSARLTEALTNPTPEELLRGTVDAYLRFLEQEPELYAFLTSRTIGQEGATLVIDVIARQVSVAIGDRLRSEGLDAGGAEPYAFGIVGMVHQAGDWWVRTRTMSREALRDYLVDLLWEGFDGMARRQAGDAPAAAGGHSPTIED